MATCARVGAGWLPQLPLKYAVCAILQRNLSLEEFVRHVAHHTAASKDAGTASSGSTIDGMQTALQQQLQSIGQLAVEGATAVSDAQVGL
jgi:hypothetical protein